METDRFDGSDYPFSEGEGPRANRGGCAKFPNLLHYESLRARHSNQRLDPYGQAHSDRDCHGFFKADVRHGLTLSRRVGVMRSAARRWHSGRTDVSDAAVNHVRWNIRKDAAEGQSAHRERARDPSWKKPGRGSAQVLTGVPSPALQARQRLLSLPAHVPPAMPSRPKALTQVHRRGRPPTNAIPSDIRVRVRPSCPHLLALEDDIGERKQDEHRRDEPGNLRPDDQQALQGGQRSPYDSALKLIVE